MKKSGHDLLSSLLHRDDPDEYCNLVKWYKASRISRLYLALSKTCGKALVRLGRVNPEERSIIPPATSLYMLRTEFIEEANNLKCVKQILGNDWREPCQ